MRYVFFVLLLFFNTSFAHAQNIDEARVKAFYGEMVELYNQPTIDGDKLLAYMNEHYDENIAYVVNLEANIFPETQHMSLTKTQMLDITKQSVSSMLDMKTSIDYVAINIDDVEHTAIVDYYLKHDGRVREVNPQGQKVDIDYTSVSGCRELLSFQSGEIVVTKAQCNIKADYNMPAVNEQDL